MRFEEVAYQKSKLNSMSGRLELTENGDVVFTKYKGVSGRFNVLIWLVIKIVMLFLKDKVIFTIPKGDFVDGTFILGTKGNALGVGARWSQLELKTNTDTYVFYVDFNDPEEQYQEFIKAVLS